MMMVGTNDTVTVCGKLQVVIPGCQAGDNLDYDMNVGMGSRIRQS